MDCRANAETAETYVRALAAQGADCRCLNPGTDTCTATRKRCSGVMARSGASNLLVTTCSTRGGSKFSGKLDSARSLRRTDYNTNPAGLVALVHLVTPRRGAARS